MVKNWSKTDEEYIIETYPKGKKSDIINKLNRSWSSIQNKAFLLDIKRGKNANVYKLISGTNESYYWLGFLMADGHFGSNNQIQINLAKKDLNHLKKFATFVEYDGELIKPNLSIGFKEIRQELENKYQIVSDKTHYPCSLDNIDGDSLFSFIIGFIDGDGSINKKGYLTIKCHNSWVFNLNKMIAFLIDGDYQGGKINSEGLAIVTLTKIEVMKAMKSKICVDLFKKGLTVIEIMNKTGLSKSQVYKRIKQKDLKRAEKF